MKIELSIGYCVRCDDSAAMKIQYSLMGRINQGLVDTEELHIASAELLLGELGVHLRDNVYWQPRLMH